MSRLVKLNKFFNKSVVLDLNILLRNAYQIQKTSWVMSSRSKSTEVEKAKAATWSKNEPTIFDKIITKEIKADIIHEDDKCLAFNDVNPQAPIHFLIIPKKRIPLLDEATPSDTELLGYLLLMAKQLGHKKAPNGYRVVINNGKDGCQSVYHLHVHVIGGRQLSWPPG